MNNVIKTGIKTNSRQPVKAGSKKRGDSNYILSLLFVIIGFSLLVFSFMSFMNTLDDNKFLQACKNNSVEHVEENIKFGLGDNETSVYKIRLSNGVDYKVSKDVYDQAMSGICK